MEIIGQGTGEFLTGGKPGMGIQPIDLALYSEDGVDPFPRFQRGRRDLIGRFALADIPGYIRKFSELPARM